MKSFEIKTNTQFIGRRAERKFLLGVGAKKQASILVVYGRRRVGKTELLEQAYASRKILKFEGIEGKDEAFQRAHVLSQLAGYSGDGVLANVKTERWTDVFKLIWQYTKKHTWTIYFEEVQWLADYRHDFVAELKYVWDNYFRYNDDLLLILCGSAPSFMVSQVLHSKALYNRSQYELPLRELSLQEAKLIMPSRSHREIMDAYLTVGGMPEYLQRINTASSIFLGICENSFKIGGYFLGEQEKIFTSSMSENVHYKLIVELLSCYKFLSRQDLAKKLKIKAGGLLTDVLRDLELCGFVEKYTPYNYNVNSKLARYRLSDAYLRFYFKFIKPVFSEVVLGDYDDDPTRAIDMSSYHKWLGFSFENYCRRAHRAIAKVLGFSAVKYKSGAYFNRATEQQSSGYQIDLLFDRNDNVITVCEIKYHAAPVGVSVIAEMERKLELFSHNKRKTVERVLISAEGAEPSLMRRAYFDRILTLDDFFADNAA